MDSLNEYETNYFMAFQLLTCKETVFPLTKKNATPSKSPKDSLCAKYSAIDWIAGVHFYNSIIIIELRAKNKIAEKKRMMERETILRMCALK